MSQKLAARGGPQTTLLAHEFDLHEYPWPKLLGTDRRKWQAVVELVDRAAQAQHRRECSGNADGRGGHAEPYAGNHAEHHQSRIRLSLVDLLSGGIPKWLTEAKP